MTIQLTKLKYRFRGASNSSFVVVFTLIENNGHEYTVFCYEHGVKGLIMDSVIKPSEDTARRIVEQYIVKQVELNLPRVKHERTDN